MQAVGLHAIGPREDYSISWCFYSTEWRRCAVGVANLVAKSPSLGYTIEPPWPGQASYTHIHTHAHAHTH
jgi:hypothetical protein